MIKQVLKFRVVIVVFLMLTLFCSNAFAWGGHGGGRYHYRGGRWYSHPDWFWFDVGVTALTIGAIVEALPPRYTTVVVAGAPYYYYDTVYYRPYYSGGYIVVPAPVVSPNVVSVPAVTQPQTVSGETVTINVPNSNGSYTPVTLVKHKDGYIGPQGEYYPGHPTVDQLKALYGK